MNKSRYIYLSFLVFIFICGTCFFKPKTSVTDVIVCKYFPTYPILFYGKENIKVISFNIRNKGKNDEGVKSWDYRKDNIIDFLVNENADIVCLQEVLFSQLTFLQKSLSSYLNLGIGCNDGGKKGKYNPIFFKATEFECQKNGFFWLSETSTKSGTIGWDAKAPRIVTWAVFKSQKTQSVFLVINTHLDIAGEMARRNSIELILNSKDYSIKDSKVIITGDFNMDSTSIPYHKMIHNTYQIVDANTIAQNRFGVKYSYHNFGQSKIPNRRRIDYIFVSRNIDVIAIDIPKENDDSFMSDHNPIITYLEI